MVDVAGVTGDVARELTRLSAEEMLGSMGVSKNAPALVRTALAAPFAALSGRLARVLAAFDNRVHTTTIAEAARWALTEMGAELCVTGAVPRGAALVCSNHPGAFDALALMAACERTDLLLIADDRAFLRAMPHLAEHLFFVDPKNATASARSLRRAIAHLRAGGALVQFGAGRIEADPAFALPGVPLVTSWNLGTGLLAIACARAGGMVLPAIVSGVHSARAKRSVVNRIAEARGITTLSLLLQVAIPSYRSVNARVAFGDAVTWPSGSPAAVVTKIIEQHARAIATSREAHDHP